MRKYEQIDKYLDQLKKDIYNQPTDAGHVAWAKDTIFKMCPEDADTVLDVGCGEGFCEPLFRELEIDWTGITLSGQDLQKAEIHNKKAFASDMSFLTMFEDSSFDMIFARHILEHSPMPLLTLMEWHRVSSKYLLLIVPAPDYWGWGGKNHYSVLNSKQWWWLLRRSGWIIVDTWNFTTDSKLFMDTYLPEQSDRSKVEFHKPTEVVEYRFLCEKGKQRTE